MEKQMKTLREEVASLREDVDRLKRIIDPDTFLTKKEREHIINARKDLSDGTTISHDELKHELGL